MYSVHLIWIDTADGSSPGFRLLCILLASQAWEAQAAGRRRGTNQRNPWDRNQDIDQYATHLTQLGWPLVQNLGFSGAVGLVCAVAFKVEFARYSTLHGVLFCMHVCNANIWQCYSAPCLCLLMLLNCKPYMSCEHTYTYAARLLQYILYCFTVYSMPCICEM